MGWAFVDSPGIILATKIEKVMASIAELKA